MHTICTPGPLGAGYSDTVRISDRPGHWVLVSGQIGIASGPSTKGLSFRQETWTCFERIGAALAQSGATLSNVVRVRVALTDLEQYPDYCFVRNVFFQEMPPASTVVQVAGLLLGARIEVEATAFVPP